uniref:Uncharacterized protein n=1 Tax=Romanomermis culicivorax TaxID=13658 RepID=A0A915ITU6_ROMCU
MRWSKGSMPGDAVLGLSGEADDELFSFLGDFCGPENVMPSSHGEKTTKVKDLKKCCIIHIQVSTGFSKAVENGTLMNVPSSFLPPCNNVPVAHHI